MMKQKDASVATSLIIQGYLRSNEESCLPDVIAAIRQEANDWAENVPVDDESAVDPSILVVDLFAGAGGMLLPRTPANIASAILAMARELTDLSGPDAVAHVIGQMNEAALAS